MLRIYAIIGLLLSSVGAQAQTEFKPLFNGKDLTGWHNVNGAPGTFYVKDNMIITTGKPTGYLRTDKQYENFILEFDWLHAPAKKGEVGNSGLFVWGDPLPALGIGYTRGIEVQVLVNLEWVDKKSGKSTATSHGDIFSIHGAKCVPERPHPLKWERSIPSENRAKGEFEWNHYRVEANDGVIKLAVNGKIVSSVSQCNPRKGYLALESEGSECRFKNLMIKELGSTRPKPNEICEVAKGFETIFTGLDLDGWKTPDNQKKYWRTNDGVLIYDGKGTAKDGLLQTARSYGDCEFQFDWKANGPGDTTIYFRGNSKDAVKLDAKGTGWTRSTVRVQNKTLTVTTGKMTEELPLISSDDGPISLSAGGPIQFRNLFVRGFKE